MANSRSSGNGQFKQTVAMASPSVALQSDQLYGRAASFLVRRVAVQTLVHAQTVILRFEQDRFRPEQVHAPETILGMPKEREPRGSIVPAFGSIVGCQNPTDHILVEVHAKGLGQVLGNLRTAKARIALLEFTDGLNQFRCGPFGARLPLRTRGVEER